LVYGLRAWAVRVWLVLFVLCGAAGVGPWQWARGAGALLGLRERANPRLLYEDETPYGYVAVERINDELDKRAFMQDKLMHSQMIMGDLLDLQYPYSQIWAAITQRFARGKEKLSVLVIGGGGYVFPRYVAQVWPGSRVDVAEIDPGVTEAAARAFGLSREAPIRTFTMDARNYVDELLRREDGGQEAVRYDFIYEDALNDYSVPFQLTTKEFNDKLARLLGDDGVYMIEMIDVYDRGLFLGAYVATLEQTFPHVCVVTDAERPRSNRNTFVIIAAQRPLDLEGLGTDYPRKELDLWVLNEEEIEAVKCRSSGFVLTDDHAPVENFLAPVVRQSSREFLAQRYMSKARAAKQGTNLEEAIALLQQARQADPTRSIELFNEVALLEAGRGNYDAAARMLQAALDYNQVSEFKENVANIHFSLGIAYHQLGQSQASEEQLRQAIAGYEQALRKRPHSFKNLARLGDAWASLSRFDEAAKCFAQALPLDPQDLPTHFKLIQALEYGGDLAQAIQANRNALAWFLRQNEPEAVRQLQKYLGYLEAKQAAPPAGTTSAPGP